MPSNIYLLLAVIIISITNGSTKELTLSPYAFWNPTAVTIDGSENGTEGTSLSQLNSPLSSYITSNNILYISDTNNHRIVVIQLNSITDKFTIGSGPGSDLDEFKFPRDLYVTNTSLYVLDFSNNRMKKMSLNGSDPTTMLSFSDITSANYIYVDNNANIYISDTMAYRVLLFGSNSTNYTIVAGTGVSGPNDEQLDRPYGIFVNQIGSIYIADQYNHRIMKWLSGASAGVRVAGDGTSGGSASQLSHPTQIIVDTNEFIYISEDRNARITRWAPSSSFGVCIAACTGTTGTASTQLKAPHSLAFDSNGSLYVNDWGNHRVQKFQILYNIISYNQPKIDTNATWYMCGITLANQNIVGNAPHGIFVNFDNTIYVPSHNKSQILIWTEQDAIPVAIQTPELFLYTNLFVTPNEDIYFENGNEQGRIDKWSKGSTNSTFVTKFYEHCNDLFIDINNVLYCALYQEHRVDKVSLNNANNTPITVAGTGYKGSAANELRGPSGIFVDRNFNLYVADSENNRIQLFRPGQTTGEAVAGLGIPTNLILAHPTDVILDADDFLYIVDNDNHRIIRSKGNQFQCIIGCTNKDGSTSYELNKPYAIQFDSYGNLYVADEFNDRIQKFILTTNPFVSSNHSSLINLDPYCNISSSLCDIYRPCQNNGTCINTSDNEYICSCPPGFNGTQCQLINRPCKPDSCWNNGICTETSNTSFDCLCPSGFSGSHCEFDGNLCKPDTCLNNGTCSRTSNTTFVCQCEVGWEGVHCEKMIDYCQNVTCQNKGVCCSSFLNYSCQCLRDSYSGRRCEIKINQSFPGTSSAITPMEPSAPNCSAPIIELIPSSFFLSTPLQFRPNQDIYISSNIEINCAQSVSITRKWTILNWLLICFNQTELLPSGQTTSNDLFVPARTLSSGIYEITLTVTMVDSPALSTSSVVYIEITQSTIITNLLSLDRSMITHDYEEDLVLNPGQFSIDLNGITFDPNNWFYSYYCRVYSANLSQAFQLFEDPNQNCFSNFSFNVSPWKYNNNMHSSVTIFAKALQSNKTFHLMVQIVHRQNSSLQSVGYLTVAVEHIQSPIIMIGCVISSMCLSNGRFHYVNPTTQLALFTLCSGDCLAVERIQWNICQGTINPSNQTVQWTPFSPQTLSWFYGFDTKNLTVLKDFFSENNETVYWRFEVIYFFGLETSTEKFDIQINEAPKNGNCSIDPVNGTMLTLFTINCSNWYDEDQIKDLTFYGWTSNSSTRLILGHIVESIIELRLPSSIDAISTFQIVVHIRDTFDCFYEFHLSPVRVLQDERAIESFIDTLQKTNNQSDNDTITQLLNTGDQNTVGQLVTSISQLFNEISNQLTPLNNQIFNTTINSTKNSVLMNINEYAQVREYLMMLIDNFSIKTPDDVKFQSSILARLTESTNQLTRKTASFASNKCRQLSDALKALARKLSLEDIHQTATHLAECAANVFNGVNGVLQGRVNPLQLDLIRIKEAFDMIEEDMDENLYYQKETSKKLFNEMNEMISSITSALNVHLNLNQTIQINTTSIDFSLEKLGKRSLSTQLNSSQIYFPSDIDQISDIILVRRIIQPLAPSGDDYQSSSFTNFSKSFSLSILNENEQEINIQTNSTNRIEFFIPRDPNLIIPSMFPQNVTCKNETNRFFNYHMINLTRNNPNLTFSIHFELHPLDLNLSYLLIYQFDDQLQLNSINNWTLFCPHDLNDEDKNYVHFLNNDQTSHHHAIIYGIRELNSTEMFKFCSNKTVDHPHPSFINTPFRFTSDYQIRLYQSGCFYLDLHNQWQSDGLVVGPLTNHSQTQCFSTHLTTFTSAFRFLLVPITLNDLRASRNEIYLQCQTNRFTQKMDDWKMNNWNQSMSKSIIDRNCKSTLFYPIWEC